MAMSSTLHEKNGVFGPAAAVVAVLLALVLAFGISLLVSANRALGLVTEAREAYAAACKSLEDGSFDEAYASARSAVDSISALPKELQGPQWSIAAALPVLGVDVQTAREMGSIAGRLADEAASPVFDQWDSIVRAFTQGAAAEGQADISIVEKLSTFAETLAHAKQVVFECEERANALPTVHIGQLNDAVSELKNTMTTVGDMLRTFDRVAAALDSADLLGGVLGGLDLGSLLKDMNLSGLLQRIL